MKPIAVWYHCIVSSPTIDSDHALNILEDQMSALQSSGLAKASAFTFIGCNGFESDLVPILMHAPGDCTVKHFPKGQSEIPTMDSMRQWCKINPGYNVFYHHIKGVSHGPTDPYKKWRQCMERVCVHQWRQCVMALEDGFDSCGAHWLTPEHNGLVTIPMWGGNFWWATSDFVATLPEFHEDTHENRFEAESWIGMGPRRPKVKDFAPHWPMQGGCW